MALGFLVNIPFLFNMLIYFISERFLPKNRETGSLVVRPWEMTKNRETRGRTVRVGTVYKWSEMLADLKNLQWKWKLVQKNLRFREIRSEITVFD